MKDYRLFYEDLLAMERRARERGFDCLADECREFRVELLARYYSPVGKVVIW